MSDLRILIADDERPAREFLKALIVSIDGGRIVGEAENGADALEMIKELKPDLALLDLQMPELTGIEVVGMLRKNQMPLVAFVTAFDEYAVKAFELNAIDYLLKPVEKARLSETLQRAAERIERDDWRDTQAEHLTNAASAYDAASLQPIERIPVRKGDDFLLIPVSDIVSIIADGELLHLATSANQKFTINYRLKDLESRLDVRTFVRLSRGSLVNLNWIDVVSPSAGGTYAVKLKNGQEISSSRLQSKLLRSRLLKL